MGCLSEVEVDDSSLLGPSRLFQSRLQHLELCEACRRRVEVRTEWVKKLRTAMGDTSVSDLRDNAIRYLLRTETIFHSSASNQMRLAAALVTGIGAVLAIIGALMFGAMLLWTGSTVSVYAPLPQQLPLWATDSTVSLLGLVLVGTGLWMQKRLHS